MTLGNRALFLQQSTFKRVSVYISFFRVVYLLIKMSIDLKLDNVNLNLSKESHLKMQYIPATVDEPTTANVDIFFNNYTTENNGFLKNSLRGFPLNGCEFQVPETHQGIVFQEIDRPLDETAQRTFRVKGTFDKFTYWNYDKQPSENDKLKQALIWNSLATALHAPIKPEEYEAAKD